MQPLFFVFNWITVIGLVVAPLIFDDKLRPYSIPYVFALLAVIYPMIVEQYTSSESRKVLKSELLSAVAKAQSEVLSALTKAQVVTVFTLADAHSYVSNNAGRAKRIHNTRLANFSNERTNPEYMRTRDQQDRGFANAILSGTEYYLVYDRTQEEGLRKFAEDIQARTPATSRPHTCVTSAVDANGMPLIQFIVLEYGNSEEECMLGYGLGGTIATAVEIYLIRNSALCGYLKRVHTYYATELASKHSK